MAELRLIAAVLLAGCTSAGADTPSGLKPPAGWQTQPAIAAAAKTALGKATVDGLEAYGEPAMGCYAVWMALRSSGSAKDVAEQLVRGLTTEPPPPKKQKTKPKPGRKLDLKDVVKPTADEGIFSAKFESPPYRGQFRARLGKGRITALACFSSQREPAACEAACQLLLGSVE